MEPYFRSLKLELTHLLSGSPKTEALKGQRSINLKKAFEARYSRPTMTRALNIAHLVLEAITLSVIAKRITADGNNVSSRGKRPNST